MRVKVLLIRIVSLFLKLRLRVGGVKINNDKGKLVLLMFYDKYINV